MFPGNTEFQDLLAAPPLAVSPSMSANINSNSFNVNAPNKFCIQYSWNGTTPVGSAVLQASNDNVIWTNVTSQMVSGNTGNGMFNVERPSYAWVRIQYIFTSGTGTFSANINARN